MCSPSWNVQSMSMFSAPVSSSTIAHPIEPGVDAWFISGMVSSHSMGSEA